MKQNSRFFAKLFNKTHRQNIEVTVDIIEYQEEDIFYVYSPALDLIGYGQNDQEARQSWEVILEEYLDYALNKKTLIKDLQSRGWVVKGKKQFKPPTFSWMLQHNEQLTDMYNKHNFHKTSRPISVPFAEVYA